MPKLIHVREPLVRAQRELLAAIRRIAAPGCNVIAVALALQPIVHAGLAGVSHIVTTLAVGYSGVSEPMKPYLLTSQVLGNMAPYVVGETHRRIPEIIQSLIFAGGDKGLIRLSFIPILVLASRGILATVIAPPTEGVKKESVKEAYTIYEDEALITVTPDGVWPTSGLMTGTGLARVKAAIDTRAETLIAIAVIDNLGKETAVVVVQSANITLGLERYLGIPTIGVAS